MIQNHQTLLHYSHLDPNLQGTWYLLPATRPFPSTGDSQIAPVPFIASRLRAEHISTRTTSPQSLHVFPNNSTSQRICSPPCSTLYSTRRSCKSSLPIGSVRPPSCHFPPVILYYLSKLGFLYFPTLTALAHPMRLLLCFRYSSSNHLPHYRLRVDTTHTKCDSVSTLLSA